MTSLPESRIVHQGTQRTCTVVPAKRGYCGFGAKVSPRGRWSLVAGIAILTQISTGIRLVD